MAGRAVPTGLLALALAGCSAEARAPAPRLAAEAQQYRSDLAKRTVAIALENTDERQVLVRSVDLLAGGFADGPPVEVSVELAAGSRVDVRVPYGELECDGPRPGSADAALLRVQDADGGQHELRLELAPGGLLDRLHVRECADQALRSVVDVRLSTPWTRNGLALEGALVLERTSGSTPVTVVEPGGNVLFTVRPARPGTPAGTLAGGATVLELPLRITATRCDVHAFADSKRSYVLPFHLALDDGEPQLVTTTADPALQRQLDRLALDTCRPGA